MNLIESIENLINESEESASKTLDKIKTAIQNAKRPDFSKIKDGEHFMYRGIEFIRLGLEQGGVLCMTAKPIAEEAFDPNGCNNWAKSRARKKLNTEFLSRLDENDLLPFESDLTADNGDTAYGKCVDKIGILSCDLYRKYRKIVPLFDEWMWTCTPWHCGTPYSGNARHVRLVGSDGTMNATSAHIASGLAPACIFHL
ncbi:MAG: hypothetical protein J6J01_05430 [Oscillospiraceae bacterium]|nr:hypothetical protein [Oscillospiraceae bacterium]